MLSVANAERLANALCRMRGAALKLGQMLSIQVTRAFDEEQISLWVVPVVGTTTNEVLNRPSTQPRQSGASPCRTIMCCRRSSRQHSNAFGQVNTRINNACMTLLSVMSAKSAIA